MIITWLGQHCFTIQDKELTIITDPLTSKKGAKMEKTQANMVTVSSSEYEEGVNAIKGEPFVIRHPGEYESKGVFVFGIEEEKRKAGSNVIYMLEVEGMWVTHLGSFQGEISQDQMTKLGRTDVLLIPVSGEHVLSAKQASEIIAMIQPHVIIPMGFEMTKGSKPTGGLLTFCQTVGVAEPEFHDKVKITDKDMGSEQKRFEFLLPV